MIAQNTNYRHYKGERYRVLFTANDSTNNRDGRQVVIYVSLAHGFIFCRDLDEFTEEVKWPDGKMRSRFVADTD